MTFKNQTDIIFISKPPTPAERKSVLFRKAGSRSGAKLTLNFLNMKTNIFKTVAIAIFSITLLLLFFSVANMVKLALN